MKKITQLIGMVALILLPGLLVAQMPDLSKPIPMDPKVRKGVLPNGMTYYIRHNAEPKERASFYIIQNVGALLENDDQNGLAHFLEHMAFNGTVNFPGKGIISTMERHGVAFGRNVNAYTAFNETVYNLSDVPTTHPGLLDTCLLVLNDWSNFLLLEEEELDAERGVISEEWRTRRNSQFRIRGKTFPTLFKGSKWAERDIIGDLDIINNFKPETIRNFYHDWYRTDLQAIAIVGDFDVNEMENKVKELFSKIPAVKNAKPRPVFEIPDNEEPLFTLATDKEATSSSVQVFFKHKAPDVKDLAYLRKQYAISLYNQMLRARLSELMQNGKPPYLSASAGFSGLVRGYNCYAVYCTAKPNMEAEGLEAIYTEVRRATIHGFNDSELQRAKINVKTGIESAFEKKDKVNNDIYCKAFKDDYLTGDVVTDAEFDYKFGLFALQTISLEEINEMAKSFITPNNRVIVVSGPENDVKHLTKDEAIAILDNVENLDIEPYIDNTSNEALISEEIKGGRVVAEKELKEFNAVEWTLSNGAKVVFRHADFDKNNVAIVGHSWGGTSLYENEDIVSASNASSFASSFGVGDFDAVSLSKILAGKNASASVGISSFDESISASGSPKDFETALQLLYLKFEKPRFDKQVFDNTIERQLTAVRMSERNPMKHIRDSISRISTNYNPRVRLMNEQYLKEIDFKKIEEIYRERFADASDFTFFLVGNIEKQTAKELVSKYIGALTDIDRKENWIDRKIEGPKGKVVKKLYANMEVPKGTVLVKYSKKAKATPKSTICQSIISNILDLRYTENIREKEGGTYGVGVRPSSARRPNESLGLSINFDCDPDKAEHLKSLVYKEIDLLIKNGPSQEDFDKVIKGLKKNHEQGKNANSYWLSAIQTYYIEGINILDPNNFDNIVDKLTTKDIQKAAKKFFKKANILDISILPK